MGELGVEGETLVDFVAEDGSRKWRARISAHASDLYKWRLQVSILDKGPHTAPHIAAHDWVLILERPAKFGSMSESSEARMAWSTQCSS